jgi:hypothetical protein
VTHRIAVTDGRITLGVIIARGDEFEAVTPHDGSLGFYPAAEAAAHELWRHARSCPVSPRLGGSSTEAAA